MSFEPKNYLAGRYNLREKTGSDVFGDIYLAEDVSVDNCLVEIRELPQSIVSRKGLFKRIRQSVIESLSLLHPSIASARAVVEDGGKTYLVSDYAKGTPLDLCLDGWGALSEAAAIKILAPIAAAIDYAHEKKVVHGNLVPKHVTVDASGLPVITGFSVKREMDEAATAVFGVQTCLYPSYRAPEQILGEDPSPSQDIYSFAAIAYEAMTGRPPFCRGSIEYQAINAMPKPVSPETPFTRAVMRALSKDPAQRPKSCGEILQGDYPKIVVEDPAPVEKASKPAVQSEVREKGNPEKPQSPKREIWRPVRRLKRQDGDGFDGGDLLYRIKTEPKMQAIAFLASVAILVAAIIFLYPAVTGQGANGLDKAQTAVAASPEMDEFYGISFGKSIGEMPKAGDKLEYGRVTEVSPAQNSFTLQLEKPLFKIFRNAKIGLKDGKIAKITCDRQDSVVDALKARMAVMRISEMIHAKYGIAMEPSKSGFSENYFNLKHQSRNLDIRISYAISTSSTSFFLSVEKL